MLADNNQIAGEASEIDPVLARACQSIGDAQAVFKILEENRDSPNALLLKAVAEAAQLKASQRGNKKAEHQAEIAKATAESIEYQVNKHIIQNPKQRSSVQKWFKSLKALTTSEAKVVEAKPVAMPAVQPNVTPREPSASSTSLNTQGFELRDETRWVLQLKEEKPSEKIISPEQPVTLNQAVQLLDCRNVSCKVAQKCKALLIENGHRVNVILESVVSSVEVINSTDCQIQVEGTAPTVSIEGSDGITLYVNENAARSMSLFTSKAAQVSIKVLDSSSELAAEITVPEQFKTTFSGELKPRTEPATHAAA